MYSQFMMHGQKNIKLKNSDLSVINSISTCFGHLYAHHQEIRLCSTAYSCLSCCSCCDALCGECCLTEVRQHSPHSASHLATRLYSITTATIGQTTIDSETQSDLLMMGLKMHETC